jgi:hypothetical protein
MIHHQNADAICVGLASALMRGITPLHVRHFEYFRGGVCKCLFNAHWLGPWRKHFDNELRLRQNHWKIIGKTKKSGFCVFYSWTNEHVYDIQYNIIWPNFRKPGNSGLVGLAINNNGALI